MKRLGSFASLIRTRWKINSRASAIFRHFKIRPGFQDYVPQHLGALSEQNGWRRLAYSVGPKCSEKFGRCSQVPCDVEVFMGVFSQFNKFCKTILHPGCIFHSRWKQCDLPVLQPQSQHQS